MSRSHICVPLEPFFDAVRVQQFKNPFLTDETASIVSLIANQMDIQFGKRAEQYYADTVIPHKIAVYNAGIVLADNVWFTGFVGISPQNWWMQLLVHDLSKFSMDEANGYAYYDFKAPTNNGDIAKENFAAAWLHHKNHNLHHPEYWLNAKRDGTVNPLEMPARYVAEMVADWMGASETYGTPLDRWLSANLETFLFHENTAKKLAFVLGEMGFDINNHGKTLSVK